MKYREPKIRKHHRKGRTIKIIKSKSNMQFVSSPYQMLNIYCSDLERSLEPYKQRFREMKLEGSL
jgi:hypothetical protein